MQGVSQLSDFVMLSSGTMTCSQNILSPLFVQYLYFLSLYLFDLQSFIIIKEGDTCPNF